MKTLYITDLNGVLLNTKDRISPYPIFRISDEFYAVENAVEELKSLAAGIIPCRDADGMAHWL